MNDKSTLIYLAENTANKIQDVKSASFRTLASCSAVFAFLLSNKKELDPSQYHWLKIAFVSGCALSILLCAFFYPDKITKSRQRLKSIYERFEPEFLTVYGDINKIIEDDYGDRGYIAFSFAYLIFLIVIICS